VVAHALKQTTGKKGSGAWRAGKRTEQADNMRKKAVGNTGREASKRRKSRLAGKT
jgi:hypothetical protein